MAIVSQKALSMAHDLASELGLVQSLTVTESFGSAGAPLIRVGAVSAAHAGLLLRVQPVSWPLATDILGNAARVETPVVIQVCAELNYAATNDNIADVSTLAQLAKILAPVFRRGTVVEIYTRANGTVPAEADITSGNLQATIHPSAVYGMIGGA